MGGNRDKMKQTGIEIAKGVVAASGVDSGGWSPKNIEGVLTTIKGLMKDFNAIKGLTNIAPKPTPAPASAPASGPPSAGNSPEIGQLIGAVAKILDSAVKQGKGKETLGGFISSIDVTVEQAHTLLAMYAARRGKNG